MLLTIIENRVDLVWFVRQTLYVWSVSRLANSSSHTRTSIVPVFCRWRYARACVQTRHTCASTRYRTCWRTRDEGGTEPFRSSRRDSGLGRLTAPYPKKKRTQIYTPTHSRTHKQTDTQIRIHIRTATCTYARTHRPPPRQFIPPI